MTSEATDRRPGARRAGSQALLTLLLPLIMSASAAAAFEAEAGVAFTDFSMRIGDKLELSAEVLEVRLETYLGDYGEGGFGIGGRARGLFQLWDAGRGSDRDPEALETTGYDLQVLCGWTFEVEGFRLTPLLGAHYGSYRVDYRSDESAPRIEQESDMLSLEAGLRLDSGSSGEIPCGGCIQLTAGPIVAGRTRETSRDFGRREGDVESGFVVDLSLTGRVVILDCGFGVEYAWRELGGDLDRTDQQWGLRFRLGVCFWF